MIWMSCWELIKNGLGWGFYFVGFFFNYFMKHKTTLGPKNLWH